MRRRLTADGYRAFNAEHGWNRFVRIIYSLSAAQARGDRRDARRRLRAAANSGRELRRGQRLDGESRRCATPQGAPAPCPTRWSSRPRRRLTPRNSTRRWSAPRRGSRSRFAPPTLPDRFAPVCPQFCRRPISPRAPAATPRVAISDSRLGAPGGSTEQQGGDGAAAFILGNENVIAEIEA